jgi:hypothetical protein
MKMSSRVSKRYFLPTLKPPSARMKDNQVVNGYFILKIIGKLSVLAIMERDVISGVVVALEFLDLDMRHDFQNPLMNNRCLSSPNPPLNEISVHSER